LKIIPPFLHRNISHRPNLVKVIDNISWLFLDKVLRMGLGITVGIWIARYLGPQQFGLLNYAIAFTGLFGAIATLGMQGVVVRDIVRAPNTAQLTLGTAAILQFIGGIIAFSLLMSTIIFLQPNKPLTLSIVAILGSMTLFKAADIAVYWFESQVQSKYIVWVKSSLFLLFSLVKVVLIIKEAPLIFFAWVILAEAAISAFALIVVFALKVTPLISLGASSLRAKSLLGDSWPLLLSGIAVMVYMKIDQIMLGQMIGDEAVGVYSAATGISEAWYFFPMIVMASVFPVILETKKRSSHEYRARLQKLYDLMVIISLSVALPMTFLAIPIVEYLYGNAYYGAGTVLIIHIWASIFVFLGVASGNWLLAENLQMISLQRTALGAFSNVILNLWLIPAYGVIGAAIATVLSQAIAALLFDLLQPVTRPMFFMKIAAMNPFRLTKIYLFRNAP
jgi:O-antigen/teichoic acid export membrane protein